MLVIPAHLCHAGAANGAPVKSEVDLVHGLGGRQGGADEGQSIDSRDSGACSRETWLASLECVGPTRWFCHVNASSARDTAAYSCFPQPAAARCVSAASPTCVEARVEGAVQRRRRLC